MAAMTLGWLIGATVLVETVFAWPGIGLYAVQSIRSFDYAPVVGLVIVTSTIYVVLYMVVDIASHFIDPRTRSA
jgi:peptide/nickel transport system permease protein